MSDKNINLENNFGFIMQGDGNHINFNNNIIPKILTYKIGLVSDNFISRDKELEAIDSILNKNSVLLVKGIGGIGKSTLSSYYCNDKKDKFDYYGFIEISNENSNLKEVVVSSLSNSLNLTSKNIDNLFNEALNKLQNLEGNKLLVIDNLYNVKNQKNDINNIISLRNSGFKILFTSREDIENIKSYQIDTMAPNDAKKLFLKWYQLKSDSNDSYKIDKILKYLDYHPLFIELTAKTLSAKKNSLSLDKIIEKFKNGNFIKIKKDKTESFKKFLCNLFKNDSILKDEKILLFLKQLSTLPSIGISFEDLQNILRYKDQEEFEEYLIELVKNGWLIKYENTYKFHQILKEFILEEYPPEFQEIEEIVKYFFELTKDSADSKVAILMIKNLIYLNSLHQVLKRFYNIFIITIFYMNMGSIFRILSIYDKALLYGRIALIRMYHFEKYLFKVVNIDEETFNTILAWKANIYNNLSQTYYILGLYKKVYILDNKALSIREKLFGSNSIYTIQCYNNLAQLYFSSGNIIDAKKLFVKAIKLINNVKEDEMNRKTIITEKSTLYSNYASFLNSTNDDKNKALKYAEESVELYKLECNNELSSELSTFEFNLAVIYENHNKEEEAEYLYKKVLEDKIKLFGKVHSDVATAYINLALFLAKKKINYNISKKYAYKALKIYQSVYSNEINLKIALLYDNMGVIFNLNEDFENANIYAIKGLNLYEKLFGVNHYTTIKSYYNVGISYYMLKKFKEAYFYIKKVVDNDKTFLEDKICQEILNFRYL